MKTFLSAIIAAVFLITATCKIYSQQKGSFELNVQNNNESHAVAFYVPQTYDAKKSYPLIIAIHGNGMDIRDMRDWLVPIADRINAILACPDEQDKWDGSGYYAALYYAEEKYNIDQNKIVASGYSMGGALAMVMGNTDADVFDMIILMSPWIPAISANSYQEMYHLPTGMFIGSADDIYNDVLNMDTFIKSKQQTCNTNVIEGMDHGGQVGNMNYYLSAIFYDKWVEMYNSFSKNGTKDTINIQPNTAEVSFGATNSTVTKSINLTNHGNLTAKINSITFSNNNGNVFATEANYIGKEIVANQTITLSIKFDPNKNIQYSTVMTISYENSEQKTLVAMSGIGNGIDTLVIKPDSINISFGKTKNMIGHTLNLKNQSSGNVKIASIVFSNNDSEIFSTTNNYIGREIAAGQTLSLSLQFRPADNLAYESVMSITYTGTDQHTDINLSGEGAGIVNRVGESVETSREGITCYPVPTSGGLSINIDNPQQFYTLKIYDAKGNLIADLSNKLIDITNSNINIDFSNLSAGTYYITAVGKSIKVTHSFVITR